MKYYHKTKTMGVRTKADEKLDEAREHLKQAQKLLAEAIHEDTWGADHFKREFIETCHECVGEIRKIRYKLD